MDELVLVHDADLSVGGNERAAWESSRKLKHTVQGESRNRGLHALVRVHKEEGGSV
jgi:hypothetical protein